MSITDDPIDHTDALVSTIRLHRGMTIAGQNANITIEKTDGLLPGETAEEQADRLYVLALRDLTATTERFRAMFTDTKKGSTQ